MRHKVKTRGRPRLGKEIRKQICIRMESMDKELVKKHFGSVQLAIDFIVKSLRTKDE
jgi:hypothetical protein